MADQPLYYPEELEPGDIIEYQQAPHRVSTVAYTCTPEQEDPEEINLTLWSYERKELFKVTVPADTQYQMIQAAF